MTASRHFDVCIAGAGIIGLSLSLALRRRGLSVVVLERGHAMREASWAAAGMLAAHDPGNPPALTPLSELSLSLYPAFLAEIESLTGQPIPFRTDSTVQHPHSAREIDSFTGIRIDSGRTTGLGPVEVCSSSSPELPANRGTTLDERSLDPRDLCAPLPLAVRAAGVNLLEHTTVTAVSPYPGGVQADTVAGTFTAAQFVNCCGAWSAQIASPYSQVSPGFVRPRKGQMVSVQFRALKEFRVFRAPDVYCVPRGDGRVVVGATVEDIGFDKSIHPADIDRLLARADHLLPGIAAAPRLEAWAGLRPGTPDDLPILGPVSPVAAFPGAASASNCFLATGHYRNGILLAPATAHVMAQQLCGESPSVSLDAFSPARFLPVLR